MLAITPSLPDVHVAATARIQSTGKVGDRKSVENDKSDKNGAYFYLFSTVQQ